MLAEADAPERVDARVTSARQLSSALEDRTLLLRGDGPKELSASRTVVFDTLPQPAFNKRYELLAKDIHDRSEAGYKVCILSDNKAQIERLGNIFASEGFPKVKFAALPVTLHEGFVDNGLRLCLYTDHQLFERYQRYSLRGEIDRSQALTVAEPERVEAGRLRGAYRPRRGAFRRSGADGGERQGARGREVSNTGTAMCCWSMSMRCTAFRATRIRTAIRRRASMLGSGAWQRMKNATKSAVKDIARELIKLYAERKESGGFAFSPDGYLQHELEASFPYEETPDQQQAVELVKHDMEQAQPMDRLVCGDVGFGKTEVAVRAAFKAVADSKQVAVLVPTTILSLQHYRTFSERLRGLPVRVENLSRVKSAREVKQIREEAGGRQDRHPYRDAQDTRQGYPVPRPRTAHHRRGAEVRRVEQGEVAPDERTCGYADAHGDAHSADAAVFADGCTRPLRNRHPAAQPPAYRHGVAPFSTRRLSAKRSRRSWHATDRSSSSTTGWTISSKLPTSSVVFVPKRGW